MQNEYRPLEHRVDGPLRAPIPILENLQDTGGTEASERLSLLVLPAVLRKVKSKSEKVHHGFGQGKQVPLRAPHPVQWLQGRRFVHLRSLYPHWYNARVANAGEPPSVVIIIINAATERNVS